jgi:hypothetical protein
MAQAGRSSIAMLVKNFIINTKRATMETSFDRSTNAFILLNEKRAISKRFYHESNIDKSVQ